MTSSTAALRISLAFLAIGLTAAAWSIPRPAQPRFVVMSALPADTIASAAPAFSAIALSQTTPSAHASSMAIMPDGSLLVAWFGGEREGAPDVAIQMARLKDGRVQEQWVSLTREQLETLTHRVIRILGNPVVWIDNDGRLQMHVVSVSYGGWSGSAVNQLLSEDGGKTWSRAHRLILSPLFNFSTLVRNQIVAMEDGTIGLPAYHEFLNKWGMWVRVTRDGRVLQCDRMQLYFGDWLQPAVAPKSATNALAVLRSGDRDQPVIGCAVTNTGGQLWLREKSLDIPNPNASVSMIRLADGSFLIAANPIVSGRNVLQLFRSRNDGATWTASRTIERNEKGGEFSYPFLAQSTDGTIYLSYTKLRKKIQLCSFTASWLDAGDPATAAMENEP